MQWIRSDRWVVAGSWGPFSSVVSRSGSYRLYDADTAHRLRFIKAAQRLGQCWGRFYDLPHTEDYGDDCGGSAFQFELAQGNELVWMQGIRAKSEVAFALDQTPRGELGLDDYLQERFAPQRARRRAVDELGETQPRRTVHLVSFHRGNGACAALH
jgi:hypothetical protein